MGTRSLTAFISEWDDSEICTIYRHWDGYPDGYGKELAEWLQGGILVNGLRGNEPKPTFNGMNRMAAYVVHKLYEAEHDPGLLKPGARDCGEDYVYVIRPASGFDPRDLGADKGPVENFEIEVIGYGDKTKFKGSPTAMLAWIEADEDEEC